jgi:hypothetical protein
MGTHSYYLRQSATRKADQTTLFINWLAALVQFYTCHQQIRACLSQPASLANFTPDTFIGQCPRHELTSLLTTMSGELEHLVGGMSPLRSSPPPESPVGQDQLMIHTYILNRLNRQVELRLALTYLPTN